MHEHEHEHEHTHEHGHDHDHPHTHGGFENPGQAEALLGYMLDHNRHHAEELHDVCHKLEHDGKTLAAEKLDGALKCFRQGNELLEAALAALKGRE